MMLVLMMIKTMVVAIIVAMVTESRDNKEMAKHFFT